MDFKKIKDGEEYPFQNQLEFIEKELEETMKSNKSIGTKGISKLEYNTMISKVTETMNFRDKGIDRTTDKIIALKNKLNNWEMGGKL